MALRDARIDAALTQEGLAETMGVSSMTVYRWESGQRPHRFLRTRICTFFGKSEEELGWRDSDKKDNDDIRDDHAERNRSLLLRQLRLLGIPFPALTSLLSRVLDAHCAEIQQELIGMIQTRLLLLDQEIAELDALRTRVATYQRQLTACSLHQHEPFRLCNDLSCFALQEQCIEENLSFLQ